MINKKKKAAKYPVFDSIRKPTAPSGVKFGNEKPPEKIHPSLRNAKHKKKVDLQNENDVFEDNF